MSQKFSLQRQSGSAGRLLCLPEGGSIIADSPTKSGVVPAWEHGCQESEEQAKLVQGRVCWLKNPPCVTSVALVLEVEMELTGSLEAQC